MSIHRRGDRQGQYEVRWREGGRQRTRLFSKKSDAQAFELDVKRQPATKRPQPLAPLTVEAIRAGMSPRNATLTSLLAYGGLRPDEATAARWDDLGQGILHVHAGKTERDRVVDLLSPLAQDLANGVSRKDARRAAP
jgi:integrase